MSLTAQTLRNAIDTAKKAVCELPYAPSEVTLSAEVGIGFVVGAQLTFNHDVLCEGRSDMPIPSDGELDSTRTWPPFP